MVKCLSRSCIDGIAWIIAGLQMQIFIIFVLFLSIMNRYIRTKYYGQQIEIQSM